MCLGVKDHGECTVILNGYKVFRTVKNILCVGREGERTEDKPVG